MIEILDENTGLIGFNPEAVQEIDAALDKIQNEFEAGRLQVPESLADIADDKKRLGGSDWGEVRC